MQISTLGGIIKDYRIKKRLSQLDISLKIGWSDTSRLSKIEQGRVNKPTRETIEKIIDALGLSQQEKGELLFHAGYLPTDDEVTLTIEQIKEKVLTWKYPAYLMDFSWRMLLINQATIDIFKFPQNLLTDMQDIQLNLLEYITFPRDIEILKGDDKNNLRDLNETLVTQFKAEHLGREQDNWYKQLVSKLAKNENFRNLWNTLEAKDYHKKLYDYEFKKVIWPDENKEWNFHIFDAKLVQDRRFSLTLYLPA